MIVSEQPKCIKIKELVDINGAQHTIPIPKYDRAHGQHSIVHFGGGGFHRSHQAFYLDQLFSLDGTSGWTICDVGIKEQDRILRNKLKAQNCFYTLVEQNDQTRSARVIGSITDYILGQDNPDLLCAKLTSEKTKIISLTVTSAGYYINQKTLDLDFAHSEIRHDLEQPREIPATMFGYLYRALKQRKAQKLAPCTVLSCDNFQGNGNIAKRTLLSFCQQLDKDLAAWIEDNITFPNCMVERITPVPTEVTVSLVKDIYGIEDLCPVVCEPFIQWVIEDKFANDRPDLERVGVQFTNNVEPYDKIKLRLLNATHTLIGYLGYIAGYRYIHQIMQDRLFAEYAMRYMDQEVTPLLVAVPGIELKEYKQNIVKRFSNSSIQDTALRICMRGSQKLPKFILPTIREQLTRNGDIKLACLAVAGWLRFLQGYDEAGNEIPIEDPLADMLKTTMLQSKGNPDAILNLKDIFADLSDNSVFKTIVTKYVIDLNQLGTVHTIAKAME